ncbi:arsenate-mycothiol transferase ArsC [Pontibacillus marinus]|uniref:protein-tyrosine-phosphatase n=1 Tax=Pontibacillus marinus BH030004 = DSM 16465 TaxID=1385511 RepID=A0A0A5GFP6_9BACI|nr:hypothetical protein [Pontibacillus marinus]KGX90844.1 hypothetical protein N783_18530 [Pontibacillus marinus BH030004 = DSM 16465]
MKRVLFVCTDNFTRSVTAEFCLKHFLNKNRIRDVKVESAGFKADSDLSKFSTTHFDRLAELGIITSQHSRTPFKQTFLHEYDLIFAMGIEHQDYLINEYHYRSPLFNEVCLNASTSIQVPAPGGNEDVEQALRKMVDYIHDHIPKVYEHIQKKGENNARKR